MGHLHRWRDPAALRMAGRVGSLADLEQRGRTSGLVRHTPVRAFRRGDTVAIGVNFGPQSQWVRNVLAADECWITLRGKRIHLVDPQLVSLGEAAHHFPGWFAWGLRRVVRTQECLVGRVASPLGPG